MNPWKRLALPPKPCPVSPIRQTQEEWLTRLLSRNKNTAYARRFGLEARPTVETFLQRVPLSTYGEMRSWIRRVARGERDVLFSGGAVAFERTGGSSGGPKLIPYSRESLVDFRSVLAPWLGDLARRHGLQGSAYFSLSPAFHRPAGSSGGIPIGLSEMDYLGPRIGSLLRRVSAVPSWVGCLGDARSWGLATLYHLLRRQDLELISVWSPTFFLELLETLDRARDPISDLLERGGILAGRTLGSDVPALRRFKSYLKEGSARALWPRLKVVSAWADGPSRGFFRALQDRLPHAHFQPKGLLATEGVVTLPGSDDRPILAARSGFFEFLDALGGVRLPDQLCRGAHYEVVMTTSGGLYRYRTGDRVRCEELGPQGPVLRFLGRDGSTSDLVGEKLTEEFVDRCLRGVREFRMLVPRRRPRPGYVLVLDRAAEASPSAVCRDVERRLWANPQYAYARRLGQLSPVEPCATSHPLGIYLGRLGRRQRLGDIKMSALRPESHWLSAFKRRPA